MFVWRGGGGALKVETLISGSRRSHQPITHRPITFLKGSDWWCACALQFTMIQYIPRNMHTVFALLCFVVVIHWLIFPYPSGLLHWHCGNLTIAPVPAKQPWWIWINTSCEFIMNDCITTTKQSTTKPCAYFLGYTVDTDKAPLLPTWLFARIFWLHTNDVLSAFHQSILLCDSEKALWIVMPIDWLCKALYQINELLLYSGILT